MKTESTEAILSIHKKFQKRLESAVLDRDGSTDEKHKMMMNGKIAAYKDMVNFLRDRYETKGVVFPTKKVTVHRRDELINVNEMNER